LEPSHNLVGGLPVVFALIGKLDWQKTNLFAFRFFWIDGNTNRMLFNEFAVFCERLYHPMHPQGLGANVVAMGAPRFLGRLLDSGSQSVGGQFHHVTTV